VINFGSFLDEMVKISSSYLSESDRRKKALLMAGLGTTAIPAMSAASTRMMTGKWLPKGVPLGKWAPAAAATGLFWGTALPAAQHYLTKSVETGAAQRRAARKELQELAPGGVQETLKAVPKKLAPAIGVPNAR
jgi:hypothetical protein